MCFFGHFGHCLNMNPAPAKHLYLVGRNRFSSRIGQYFGSVHLVPHGNNHPQSLLPKKAVPQHDAATTTLDGKGAILFARRHTSSLLSQGA